MFYCIRQTTRIGTYWRYSLRGWAPPLPPRDRMEEALFTGLRLSEGVSADQIRAHYGIDLWAEFGGELQPFRDLGWLIYDEGRLRLTRAGMLLAHEIMAVFIRPS